MNPMARPKADRGRSADARWRKLTRRERRILFKNGNIADDWNNLSVKEGFLASAVRGCSFIGINRIGVHTEGELKYQKLRLPVGISNSVIISCEIGDNSAIHNVRYISGYTVGARVVLFNTDEMIGAVEGPDEKDESGTGRTGGNDSSTKDDAPRIAVANENGGRKIPLFSGMTAGDAFLCSRNRDRAKFQENTVKMAEAISGLRAKELSAAGLSADGLRPRIGSNTVIKSCRCIENTTVADNTRIIGANLLKDVTIDSSPEIPTYIGEGVELVSGYIGIGCNVSFGVKAIRFSLATNVTLNNGARCIDSVLGDNITVSCCEVVSALVFPFHEQHHNNSFLIAATVQGQCDIAAGATVGSNHNSRAADGEIFARRGFWPGLCANLKHPSRFASFCLIAKGTYPAELNISLPFTLVSNDVKEDKLQLYPGYWFKHNMYGLGRNSWKLKNRDAKLYQWQTYEYDYLAPDTVEELFAGMEILETWRDGGSIERGAGYPGDSLDCGAGGSPGNAGDSSGRGAGYPGDSSVPEAFASSKAAPAKKTDVDPAGIEASSRGVTVLYVDEAYNAYRDMIYYYGIGTLLYYMHQRGLSSVGALREELGHVARGKWLNIGGQLITAQDYRELITGVEDGSITTWEEVHTIYQRCSERYPFEKARHALASLLSLHRMNEESDLNTVWNEWIDFGVEIQNLILNKTIESRGKDYQRWFKKMMYDSDTEMFAVLGNPDENEFIEYLKAQTEKFVSLAGSMRR